jgi:hypothetical protein
MCDGYSIFGRGVYQNLEGNDHSRLYSVHLTDGIFDLNTLNETSWTEMEEIEKTGFPGSVAEIQPYSDLPAIRRIDFITFLD